MRSWRLRSKHGSSIASFRSAGAATLNALHEQAQAEGACAVLAPTPELRAWVSILRGARRGPAVPDELPSVALPMRLVARVPPMARVAEVLAAANADAVSLEIAVACDLAAALGGRTLEAWAYAAALRRLLGGPLAGAGSTSDRAGLEQAQAACFSERFEPYG